MIDMRSEEDLSPHSQVRHELMHNQYNKLKEEEDHWQDVSGFRYLCCFSVLTLVCGSQYVCVCICFFRIWPNGRVAGGACLRT